jgi:hypothetical protein
MELYSQILDHGGNAFGTVLRHVRDHPENGCLFHCTGQSFMLFRSERVLLVDLAGKDRTGVLAALLLKLAGVNDDTIAEDYALTRVGREPARETVLARLAKMPMFASNNERAMNMLTSRSVYAFSAFRPLMGAICLQKRDNDRLPKAN